MAPIDSPDRIVASETSSSPAQLIEDAPDAIGSLGELLFAVEKFQQYLSTYENMELVTRQLDKQKKELEEKDEEIAALKGAFKVLRSDTNEEMEKVKVQREESNASKDKLGEQLKWAQGEIKSLQEEVREKDKTLGQMTSDLVKLKEEMPKMKREKEAAEKKLEKAKEMEAKFKTVSGYQANLVKFDTGPFRKKMEVIRERTHVLAGKYFTTELPLESLKHNQRSWVVAACQAMRQEEDIPHIAPTNSREAQFGRTALVLNILAFALEQYIFTSVTTALGKANLDDMLMDIAEGDLAKERLCRAILLSISDRYPDRNHSVESEKYQLISLMGQLLPKKEFDAFSQEALDLMADAAELWGHSRWSRQKIFATMIYDEYPDFWRDIAQPETKHQDTPHQNAATDLEDPAEEVRFVTFPAIIQLELENEAKAVLPGVVVRNSHIAAAKKEWETKKYMEKNTDKKPRRFSRGVAL